MGKNLYQKVFERHTVRELEPGQYQLFMGLQLIHEVTSPQAFSMLREAGLPVLHPERTYATADHVIPTKAGAPFATHEAREMAGALEKNTSDYGIRFFSPDRQEHGIVHVIGPEYGLTQPGMTICCGDSHTSTHGAFGAIAFGIGTSQVRDVLASQTMVTPRLKVRQIHVSGRLNPGVTAKDLSLHIIRELGTKAGVGYAYEFAGPAVEALSMEERMTLCNMAVEAGARCGYVNPDQVTFDYLKDRPFAPSGADWDQAVNYWQSCASDADAQYDHRIAFNGNEIRPMVTYGTTPAHSLALGEPIAEPENEEQRDALDYMKFRPGDRLEDQPINVAFIGSCTNGRYSDLRSVADLLLSGSFSVAAGVRALIVPGSAAIRKRLVEEGLNHVFESAGFEFREPGCSMCLAMNGDMLQGDEICASSSNRNFKGRQGSPSGRTLLMSPVMVAAAAIKGRICDPRELSG